MKWVFGLFLVSFASQAGIVSDHIKEHGLPDTVLEAAQLFNNFVSGERFTAENCSEELRAVHHLMIGVEGKDFDTSVFADLSTAAATRAALMQSKLLLREKVAALFPLGKINIYCEEARRLADNAIRVLNERVSIEVLKQRKFEEDLKKHTPPFGGFAIQDYTREFKGSLNPYLTVNPKYEFVGIDDLEPGDILVSIGGTSVSSSISRITKMNGQFSHNSMIAYDPETGQKINIEALIEVGMTWETLADYTNHKSLRILVMRHPDRELAQKAAEHALKFKDSGVGYDMSMNPDPDTISADPAAPEKAMCTKVVAWAYHQAAKELGRDPLPLPIPETRSTFQKGLGDLLPRLGVTSEFSHAPADTIHDRRLDLVAEWTNVGRISEAWVGSVVADKMFEWMEFDGYRFNYSFEGVFDPRIKFLQYALPILTWIRRGEFKEGSWRGELLKTKLGQKFRKTFPGYATDEAIEAIAVLDMVDKRLRKALNKARKKHFRKHKSEMSYLQMYNSLESFRTQDEKVHLKVTSLRKLLRRVDFDYDRSKFHWAFTHGCEDSLRDRAIQEPEMI